MLAIYRDLAVPLRNSRKEFKELTPILSADLVERADDFQLHVDLPGVDASDLEVTIANGMVNIKAERKQVHEDKAGLHHRIERSFGSVQRSIPIPKNANSDSADASFVNGVLTVQFAKRQPQGSRKLDVKLGTTDAASDATA